MIDEILPGKAGGGESLASTVVTHTGSNRQPFRRRPTQQRARMTFHSIQQACLKILRDKGESALNTNYIAEVAGTSVGTVYKYFPNKEAIIESLCNDMLMESLHSIDTSLDALIESARESLENAVERMIQMQLERHRYMLGQFKGFYRDIHWKFDYESYVTGKLPGRINTARWFAKVLRKYRDELQVDDIELASSMVAHIIDGTVHSVIARDPDMLFDPALGQELAVAILRYLKAPG